MDVTLQQVLFRLAAYAVVAAVHGWALAAAAGLAGDPGPRYDGRRTLDPFAQGDPFGAACAAVFGLSWIRPMALDGSALGRLGRVAAALAGLAAVRLLALVAALLRGPVLTAAAGTLPLYGVAFLETLALVALGFAILNLVPLPPFAGGHFLLAALPRLAPLLERWRLAFTLLAAAFVASGAAARLIAPLYRPLARWLLGG